jgi:hypothetical protein
VVPDVKAEIKIIVESMTVAWEDNRDDKDARKRYAMASYGTILDTGCDCCEDHYQHRC